MMKNLYDEAESGCLFGVSVWGDRELNKFNGYLGKAAK